MGKALRAVQRAVRPRRAACLQVQFKGRQDQVSSKEVQRRLKDKSRGSDKDKGWDRSGRRERRDTCSARAVPQCLQVSHQPVYFSQCVGWTSLMFIRYDGGASGYAALSSSACLAHAGEAMV